MEEVFVFTTVGFATSKTYFEDAAQDDSKKTYEGWEENI